MGTVDITGLEDLVRTLIKRAPVDEGRDQRGESDGSEEIVLDLDVDGARYLLVRLPRPGQVSVQLSPREREIVRLVAQGHSNKIIADVLGISSWTVCTHMRRIFAKLGVGSRAAMVAHAAAAPVRENKRRSAVVIAAGELASQRLG